MPRRPSEPPRLAPWEVPALPLFAVHVLEDGSVTVDGEELAVAPGADPRRAALDDVRAHAVAHGRPVRAIAVDPDGTRRELIVPPVGEVVPVSVVSAPPLPAVPRHEPRPGPGRTATVPLTKKTATTPPGILPVPLVPAIDPLLPDDPADPDGALREDAPPGRRTRTVAVAAAVLATVAVTTTVALWPAEPAHDPTLAGRAAPAADTSNRPPTTKTTAPATPKGTQADPSAQRLMLPAGWSARPAWSSPATAELGAGEAAVAVHGNVVAVLTPDHRVAVLDAATGQPGWTSAPLPRGHSGVHATRDGTAPVFAVRSGDVLHLWPATAAPPHAPTAPEPVDVPLPHGARLSYAGDVPLLTAPDGSASAVRGGTPVRVAAAPGATVMAADDTLAVSSAGPGPWTVHTAADTARTVVPAPPRDGARMLRVVGAGHGLVAAIWSGPAEGEETLAVHDATTGVVRATADAPAAAFAQAHWIHPAGPVAAFGPAVVDFGTDGVVRTEVNTAFRARSAAGGVVYGTRGDTPARFRPGHGTDDLPHGAAVPWAAAERRALVLTRTPDGAALHAVDAAR
ncbi:hypothetical protein OG216_47450 (plasmid) [Streptomycetaceae bacterium NBC_01309]